MKKLLTIALAALALQAAPTLRAQTAAPSSTHTTEPLGFHCQDATCDGELWMPHGAVKPPVIVMAHGFGAQRSWGLPRFAERFVQAGFAVYLFDYRGFGASGGAPRGVVDGREQVKDWEAAVDFVHGLSQVDGKRIGIWGSSYSGGSVLATAARRPALVKAVSSQVPFVSGWSSALQFPLKYQPLAFWYALRDLLRGKNEEPYYVPIVAKDAFAALVCPECWEGYGKLVPKGSEPLNRVAARVFLDLPFYSPGSSAADIQAPVLLMAAEKDGLIPVEGVRRVARKIKQVEYVELKGADHFSPYDALFDSVAGQQVAFFRRRLAAPAR